MAFSYHRKVLAIKSNIGMGEIARKVIKRTDMVIALALLAALVVIAAVAPYIAPYDPNGIDMKNKNLGPGPGHLLGTDYLGRDLLSRILVGARTSLSIAAGVVGISLAVGIAVGAVSGYYGGVVDDIIARVIDIFMSFPGMIFALAMLGVMGPGIVNLMFSLALVQWSTYARLMRGQVLSVKNNEYIASAVTIGASDRHILARHVIPNAIAPIIVLATIDLGHVILSIAALSFLGIGLPADVPEWGAILSSGKEFMRTAPFITIFPGLAITFVVVIFSVLGDGMRSILDPHGGEIP